MLLLPGGGAADAVPEDDADAGAVPGGRVETGVRDGLANWLQRSRRQALRLPTAAAGSKSGTAQPKSAGVPSSAGTGPAAVPSPSRMRFQDVGTPIPAQLTIPTPVTAASKREVPAIRRPRPSPL